MISNSFRVVSFVFNENLHACLRREFDPLTNNFFFLQHNNRRLEFLCIICRWCFSCVPKYILLFSLAFLGWGTTCNQREREKSKKNPKLRRKQNKFKTLDNVTLTELGKMLNFTYWSNYQREVLFDHCIYIYLINQYNTTTLW